MKDTKAGYATYTDPELVSLLKKDDHIAYAEIYNRYKWVLYLHALRRIGDREQSKDIVQELFLALWDKRANFDLRSHLSGYLYTSVRNRIIKYIAHQKVESAYVNSVKETLNEGKCITDHSIREKSLAAIIEKEIAELPEKMREVFILSRKHNLNHKEIALQLGIEDTTVKRQISNALKILREKLGIIVWLLLFFKIL
ncbi:RNA polymerase sigma-70 factor [Pedobacter nyackensis]|uniref:RNA polymerase sigma factor n=1 Tax=Pedobacter nyackensis TaxID=475255 RepID=UPI00292E92E8|nr:RNA polymerase sigma-70 factor [Pedobacter nyackensis]